MKSDRLAYWYLRLNGFLTSQNYIIHDGVGGSGSQRTEIDILGVRFPYKAEKLENRGNEFETMDDEDIFKKKDKIYIIIAEAKKGRCDLNSPLEREFSKNMQRALEIIGVFEEKAIEKVARKLYVDGFYVNDSYCLSLICFGKSTNYSLERKYPKLKQQKLKQQITWCEVLEFIYNRFDKYRRFKSDHSQWDCDGKQLWNCFECNTKSNFKNEIISCLE